MIEYYCNCLNICVQFREDSDHLDEYNLSDEEKQSDFFQQLPLIIVQRCVISEQHTALVQLNVIGSWIVHKCTYCSTYTHALKSDESTTVMFINGTLRKLTEQESELKKESSEYSPVFQILITNLLCSTNYIGASHLSSETSNAIIELKELLAEKVEERREVTNKLIEKFVLEQENALKSFIKRANDDFQSIKSAVLSNCTSEKFEPKIQEKDAQKTSFANSVINDFSLLADSARAENQIEERNSFLMGCQTSFDSEGLFPLDGMEKNDVIEDEDQSEEDLSDTDGKITADKKIGVVDNSGSRDEGIHIPRTRSVAISKSVPISAQPNFDLSLRVFDDRFEDDKRKPNYKRKMRNERPVDIAASMKALANSVHGDTIFGDLPPPRIGSRI